VEIFKRRNNSKSFPSEPEPVEKTKNKFSQSDFDAGHNLMMRYKQVRGNGSDQDLAEVLEKFGEIGDGQLSKGWNRPWVWWSGLAQSAYERGDYSLAFLIFAFSVDYMENIGPKLPNNFALGVGYGMIEDDSMYKAIASVGLEAIEAMQAERSDIDFSPEIAKAQNILTA